MNIIDLKTSLKKKFGKEWWDETEKILKEKFDYPKIYPIPEQMKSDYHPVFRNLLYSIFPFDTETGGTKRLEALGRTDKLQNMRVLPQYLGILDPTYTSRARHNFGLVMMKTEPNNIFSRAYLNIPFPMRQKLKRLVLEVYGISKHGRAYSDIDMYEHGGIFLLNPDRDPEFDKYTKYHDYHYVTLNVRFPKNRKEWLLTIDGSVLISKSAAKKLRYKKRAYVLIRYPTEKLTKKFLFWFKGVKEGAHVEFQEPLSRTAIDNEEMVVGTSPVDGYIIDAKLLTPKQKDPMKQVWLITIEDERDAELGLKLESATGLKNTVAGYTDDKEPTIVINPDMLKDRNLYYEIKYTGKAHVYPTLSGKDGNISNRGARISNTLIQGIFSYPEKIRKKIIQEMFTEENLMFPYPNDILKRLEKLKIDDLSIFYPYMYYIRFIKKPNGNVIPNVQPTALQRAIEKYHDGGWKNLSNFYKNEINRFIQNMTGKLLLGDRDKRTAIRLKAVMRITLWHAKKDTDLILMGKELIEQLGNPEYVLVWKEPVSRQENIRCMKVEHDKSLDNHPQVVRVHPYIGKDYGKHAKVDMRMKIDTDGDLLVILPIKNCIKELQYNKRAKFEPESLPKSINKIPKPDYAYKLDEFLYEIYQYHHFRSLENLVIQSFGGLKNYLMYTDIIKDTKAWNQILDRWDIEAQAMQLEKLHPELKGASYEVHSNYLYTMYKEALSARKEYPPQNELTQIWLKLPNTINFETFPAFKKMIKSLKKSKHPILELYYEIYKTLKLI